MENKLKRYPSKLKAIDYCLWHNFTHRTQKLQLGVVLSIKGDFLVVPVGHPTFEHDDFEVLPTDYSNMSYKHMKIIGMDEERLHVWEELLGIFSTMSGEIMRFILHMKVPLYKMIRWELANRGYDENNIWVGYDRAYEIWLTE